jgi:hypothetical protein
MIRNSLAISALLATSKVHSRYLHNEKAPRSLLETTMHEDIFANKVP